MVLLKFHVNSLLALQKKDTENETFSHCDQVPILLLLLSES